MCCDVQAFAKSPLVARLFPQICLAQAKLSGETDTENSALTGSLARDGHSLLLHILLHKMLHDQISTN